MATVEYSNGNEIHDKSLDVLFSLVQKEENGESLTPVESALYVALYEYLVSNGVEVPFGVEI